MLTIVVDPCFVVLIVLWHFVSPTMVDLMHTDTKLGQKNTRVNKDCTMPILSVTFEPST